jgi:nitrite reductase/ring-hydroxylating ferredoxin subunit
MVSLGTREDFPVGGRVVSVGGREIAVFYAEGRLSAYDNRCPHAGSSLGEGLVRDGQVICPGHWWRYELATGRCAHDPRVSLRPYPIEVRDGQVLVEVPEVEPALSLRELLLRHARDWKAAQGD